MLGIKIRLLWLAVILAVLVAVGWEGYVLGYRAAEAKHTEELARAQARAFEAAELASKKEADRLALQMERDALSRELVSQAYSDPDRDRPALSADSVRRLRAQ